MFFLSLFISIAQYASYFSFSSILAMRLIEFLAIGVVGIGFFMKDKKLAQMLMLGGTATWYLFAFIDRVCLVGGAPGILYFFLSATPLAAALVLQALDYNKK